ncbi:TolC family protein [Flavobacterium sp. Fl-318]|uniref:TolC family protein n=1 Tax=Flavobacterium cupriresistens TaxID=2893885 RepID=A0ABU4R9P3_9FLAO|nr:MULTISPECIES: TolC family protein [unclassified Flavobacterium]MDX6189297.1 TolC family protein [Flavobacterium sp. Fl-318]UFH41393.1 TolC family protein [Flavobacterium sp. F-323]
MRKLHFTASVFLLFVFSAKAQSLTIDSSYKLAENNYPLIKQYDLIEKTKEYNISNANKAYLPQVSITAIEGYVFGDFPSMGSGSDSKFKFIGIGQVNQTIWDGGATKTQKKILESSTKVKKTNIDVSLRELRSRVNQLYFGILLIDEQLKQLAVQNGILNNNIDKVKKLNENGYSYKMDVDEIQVEQLKLKQQQKDFIFTRKGYIKMLSYLINTKIDDQTKFEKPITADPSPDATIKRPELLLYQNQRDLADVNAEMHKVNLMPKIGVLGAGIMLAPGMSLGNTTISTLGVVGLNASWNINALYKNGNEKELTKLEKDKINVQEQTFLFNTNLQIDQKTADIDRQKEILKDDDAIIALRANIQKGYQLKYDNGAGPLVDLLNAIENEKDAHTQKALHEIQLLMSMYDYQTIIGN